MNEKMYEELIMDYLPDDETWVKCLDIAPIKVVIAVDKNSGEINHYENRQYYFAYKNIFMENFAEPLIDCIDHYDYLLEYYPSLADDLLDLIVSKLSTTGKPENNHEKYIEYVSKWYKEHPHTEPPLGFRLWFSKMRRDEDA